MKVAFISDFSKTLTAPTNPTTWSVFAKSGLLGSEYTLEREALFQKHYDGEQAQDIEGTKAWWKGHLDLFVKYGLNDKIIHQIISDSRYFDPRTGLRDLFTYLFDSSIELNIITSSGVSTFVEAFLKYHDIYSSDIQIIGNTLRLDSQGEVIGYDDDIICSLNKYDHNIDLSIYDKVILLGDDEGDICMYEGKNCIKIGLCEQGVAGYDVYLGKNGSLLDVIDIINKEIS